MKISLLINIYLSLSFWKYFSCGIFLLEVVTEIISKQRENVRSTSPSTSRVARDTTQEKFSVESLISAGSQLNSDCSDLFQRKQAQLEFRSVPVNGELERRKWGF